MEVPTVTEEVSIVTESESTTGSESESTTGSEPESDTKEEEQPKAEVEHFEPVDTKDSEENRTFRVFIFPDTLSEEYSIRKKHKKVIQSLYCFVFAEGPEPESADSERDFELLGVDYFELVKLPVDSVEYNEQQLCSNIANTTTQLVGFIGLTLDKATNGHRERIGFCNGFYFPFKTNSFVSAAFASAFEATAIATQSPFTLTWLALKEGQYLTFTNLDLVKEVCREVVESRRFAAKKLGTGEWTGLGPKEEEDEKTE